MLAYDIEQLQKLADSIVYIVRTNLEITKFISNKQYHNLIELSLIHVLEPFNWAIQDEVRNQLNNFSIPNCDGIAFVKYNNSKN